MREVRNINITESYLLRRVAEESERRGDTTVARTASTLLHEYLTILDLLRRLDRGDLEKVFTSLKPSKEQDTSNPSSSEAKID